MGRISLMHVIPNAVRDLASYPKLRVTEQVTHWGGLRVPSLRSG